MDKLTKDIKKKEELGVDSKMDIEKCESSSESNDEVLKNGFR